MSKNTLGKLILSPVKENGRFVFMNTEIRMNNKLNKGDSIKIYISSYTVEGDRHILKGDDAPTSQIVVRGNTLKQEHPTTFTTVEQLYEEVCALYRNEFYFGKTGS